MTLIEGYEQTIFPMPSPAVANEAICHTREELFGAYLFPGTNGNDILELQISGVRTLSEQKIRAMGLLPAI